MVQEWEAGSQRGMDGPSGQERPGVREPGALILPTQTSLVPDPILAFSMALGGSETVRSLHNRKRQNSIHEADPSDSEDKGKKFQHITRAGSGL